MHERLDGRISSLGNRRWTMGDRAALPRRFLGRRRTKSLSRFVLTLSVVVLMFGLACQPRPTPDISMKMDALMRQFIQEGSRDRVHFSGQCVGMIDDAVRKRLEKSGVQLQTVVEDRFTAVGKRRPILKLARDAVILRLILSKPVRALEREVQ